MSNPTKFSPSEQSSNGKSKRAAIYARVSSEKQKNNYSLPTQIEKCKAYIAEHGYTLDESKHIYVEAFTAAKLSRASLDGMRDAARRSEFDVVVVIDMDRQNRGGIVAQLLLDTEFKKYGAPFEYVLEYYEDSPEGAFQKSIRAAVAQLEREKFLQRSKRGRDAYLKSGHVIRGRVDKYGYRYANKAEGKSNWEIVPDEAEIVRNIYQWYIFGDETGNRLGQGAIAHKLAKLGVPTRYDKDLKEIERANGLKKRPRNVWTPIVISRILSDEAYAGVLWHNKRRRIEDEITGKKHVVPTPKEEWIPVPIPAIVSRETWEAARHQAALNEKNASRNARRYFVLRGMIRCSRCNGGFSGTHKGNDPLYRCKGADPGKWAEPTPRTCKGYIYAEDIEVLVWDTIKEMLRDPNKIEAVFEGKQTEFKPQVQLLTEQLEAVITRILEIEKAQENLLDLFLDPDSTLTKDTFNKKNAALKMQHDECAAQRAHLEHQLASTEIPANMLPSILDVCQKVIAGYDEFTPADKRQIYEWLHVSVTVQRGETRDQDRVLVTGDLPTTNPREITHLKRTYLMSNFYSVPFSFIHALPEHKSRRYK